LVLFISVPACFQIFKKCRKKCNSEATEDSSPPTLEPPADVSYNRKALDGFQKLLIDGLGEILIYPSIICNLYSFINEKGWKSENGALSVFDLLLLLYGIAMDIFYAKIYYIYYIYLLKRFINDHLAAYNKHEKITATHWRYICFRPFSFTLPFSSLLAVTHWLMLAIIGIRIYADNFATVNVVTNLT